MNWIPGQPILFSNDTTTDCCLDCWEQVVFENDTVMWQFNVPPCFNIKPVTLNCNFTTNQAWTLFNASYFTLSDKLKLENSGSFITQGVFTIGDWYKITLTIDVVAPGFSLAFIGFENAPTLTEAGSYELFLKAASTVCGCIVPVSSASPIVVFGAVTISEFCATGTTEPTFKLFDSDGNELLSPVFAQIRTGQFVTWMFDIEDNSAVLGDIKSFYFEVNLLCDGVSDTWTSEVIKIIPIDSCHLQMGWCGNVDRFNFDYFVPTLRIEALLRPSNYQFEDDTYKATNGKITKIYAESLKVYELLVEEAPEHVLDFFGLFPIMQQVSIRKRYVQSKDYIIFENEFGLNYLQGSDNLARITMSLVEQESNFVNYFEGGYCTVGLPPRVLGTENANEAILTEDDKLIEVE